jgi:hypothetical protein
MDEIARAVEALLSTELKKGGYNPKMAPIIARSLVGMIALPGQWWLDEGGKPKRKNVAQQIVNLAWNGLGNLRHDKP